MTRPNRRVRGRLAPEAMFPAGHAALCTRYAVTPGGLRLRVVEAGAGDAPVALLLHGWGASAYMYRYLAPTLATAGFRVLVPDARGHGLSDKPRDPAAYRLEALLDDLRGLLRVLGAASAPVVVGQSMGGRLALELALDPAIGVRRLVLINPAGLCPVRVAQVGRRFSPRVLDRFARHLVPRRLVRFLLRACYGDPTRVRERDVDEYWAPSQDPGYARAMRALLCDFDWRPLPDERLRALTVPTLVVAGGRDRVIPGAAGGASHIPGATVELLPRAGHVAHEEWPDVVDAAIARFVGATGTAGASAAGAA